VDYKTCVMSRENRLAEILTAKTGECTDRLKTHKNSKKGKICLKFYRKGLNSKH